MTWSALFALMLSAPSLSVDAAVTEQQTVAQRLAAKSQRSEVWSDKQGNVTGLIFINHQALTNSAGNKPGVSDADLAELSKLPDLTAINLEAQPVGDSGLQVLRQFPRMKQVGFHYMGKADGAGATPDFITVIDGMRDLEIVEIKHNFRMQAVNIEKLKGPFPRVWRLVLDTPVTADQTLHMIRLCPNVTDLQLHRTDVSAKQLAGIGRLLPRLEVLWFKPKRELTAGHLTAISQFPKLRILSPQHFKNELPFERGWDALASHDSLQRLEIAGRSATANRNAIDRLKRARPSLVVDSRLTRSRNYDGL